MPTDPKHPRYVIPEDKYDQVMAAAYFLQVAAKKDPRLMLIQATRELILQVTMQAARNVTDNEEWIKWLEIALPFCDDQLEILKSKDKDNLFA